MTFKLIAGWFYQPPVRVKSVLFNEASPGSANKLVSGSFYSAFTTSFLTSTTEPFAPLTPTGEGRQRL